MAGGAAKQNPHIERKEVGKSGDQQFLPVPQVATCSSGAYER